MKNAVRKIEGNWDLGYVLDKHVLSSIYTGDNAQGHAQFDTLRSEVGEALFQLKYRHDWRQIPLLAAEMAANLYSRYKNVEILIPMPASNIRARQPVTELTEALGKIVKIPVFEDLLRKKRNGKQLKDLTSKAEKVAALKDSFSVNDQISGEGEWNALIVDDLYATGASMDAACAALRSYPKVRRIYVAALTWR